MKQFPLYLILLIAFLAIGPMACSSGSGDGAEEGDGSLTEPTESVCNDGVDDDEDGTTDCDDSDCASNSACVSTETNCTDTKDDDADGNIDCDDSDCSTNSACATPTNETNCTDTKDDDADGKIDCDDSDCSSNSACTGGTDTDADGYVSSADCNDSNAAINPAATEVCGDDVDNDCDSKIDSADDTVTGMTTYYLDADTDTFGSSNTVKEGQKKIQCTGDNPATSVTIDGQSWVLNNSDCDDDDAEANDATVTPSSCEHKGPQDGSYQKTVEVTRSGSAIWRGFDINISSPINFDSLGMGIDSSIFNSSTATGSFTSEKTVTMSGSTNHDWYNYYSTVEVNRHYMDFYNMELNISNCTNTSEGCTTSIDITASNVFANTTPYPYYAVILRGFEVDPATSGSFQSIDIQVTSNQEKSYGGMPNISRLDDSGQFQINGRLLYTRAASDRSVEDTNFSGKILVTVIAMREVGFANDEYVEENAKDGWSGSLDMAIKNFDGKEIDSSFSGINQIKFVHTSADPSSDGSTLDHLGAAIDSPVLSGQLSNTTLEALLYHTYVGDSEATYSNRAFIRGNLFVLPEGANAEVTSSSSGGTASTETSSNTVNW